MTITHTRVAMLSTLTAALTVFACSSDDDSGGGSGGKSGSAGSAGSSAGSGGTAGSTGGSSGSGATGGTSGSGGSAGTAGSGGTAGGAGSAGAGGSAGAAGSAGSGGSAGAAGSAGSSGSAGAAGSGGSSGAAGSAGSGGSAGGCSGPALTPQCSTTPSQVTFCFEHADGCPGDTVAVDVHVLAPAGCTHFNQSTASFESLTFTLANQQSEDGPAGICQRRDLCSICTPPVFDWAELPASAIGGTTCPETTPVGMRGTLQVTIPMGTAAGDYPLGMDTANIITMAAACGGTSSGGGFYESTAIMPPTIRVH